MKKLSQTWRQKRPRNTCHSSNNVRRKSGTKDTPEEEENDFDLMVIQNTLKLVDGHDVEDQSAPYMLCTCRK